MKKAQIPFLRTLQNKTGNNKMGPKEVTMNKLN
jgi:hypothetical protein